MASKGVGYGVTGCGCFASFLALAVTLFCAFHVFLDPRGKISRSEAMPGFIGGLVCMLPMLVVAAIGIYLVMSAGKDAPVEGQPPE